MRNLLKAVALTSGLGACDTYTVTQKVYEGQYSGHNVQVRDSFLAHQPVNSEVTLGSSGKLIFGKFVGEDDAIDHLCAEVSKDNDGICFRVSDNNPPTLLAEIMVQYNPALCTYGHAETDPERGNQDHESCRQITRYDPAGYKSEFTKVLDKFGVHSREEIEQLLRDAKEAVKLQPDALKKSETRREWVLLL